MAKRITFNYTQHGRKYVVNIVTKEVASETEFVRSKQESMHFKEKMVPVFVRLHIVHTDKSKKVEHLTIVSKNGEIKNSSSRYN